ncbi:bifunctional folylpolyglutamate synthase/dihydrofolate synthase [Brevundimonas lutea]|uniref:bifunctional folylpolyglutamate synthase/dihydrofolate synthase n=1 Tax=Brevundimonas lutea TaxID=2293980 RepID=UPI001F0C4A97|nr:folylpolyglutamate synthase/dihydrofolate synthase family protein [Brevundimonas lutea]
MTAADPFSRRLLERHPQKIDLSLDRMRAVCRALGDPQDRLPPVVHVAGTNGKGSTVAFLRAMAEAAGLTVHAYTSPHLVRFNERIRLAGTLIDNATLAAALDAVEAAERRSGVRATVFEATTAAAFLTMAEIPADLALIEVGLGGSLDATNVIGRPLLSVITPVDLDHAEFLGPHLEGVAAEKAGILKPGAPAVIARQAEVAMAVIARRAEQLHVPMRTMGEHFDAWGERGGLVFQDDACFLDLPAPALVGPHQIDNAGLAVAAALELDLPGEAIADGLTEAHWPARMQRLTGGPLAEMATRLDAELWLDGGHNPHAARALVETVAERHARSPRPLALIVGLLTSKDAAGFLGPLADLNARVLTVSFESGTAWDARDLADQARASGLDADASPGVEAALHQALVEGARRIVICGSLYLAGEVLVLSPDTWPV